MRISACLWILLLLLWLPVGAKTDPTGVWYIEERVCQGEKTSAQALGVHISFDFRPDGVVWVSGGEETAVGTWLQMGDQITILDAFDHIIVTRFAEDRLLITQDNVDMYLSRELLSFGEKSANPVPFGGAWLAAKSAALSAGDFPPDGGQNATLHSACAKDERIPDAKEADFRGEWVAVYAGINGEIYEAAQLDVDYTLQIDASSVSLRFSAQGETVSGNCRAQIEDGVMTLSDDADIRMEAWRNDCFLTLQATKDRQIIFARVSK